MLVGLGPGWELERRRGGIFVGHHAQEVGDAVQAGASLIVCFDCVPRRFLEVGMAEHLIFGFRELDPFIPCLNVHLAKLPPPGGVSRAIMESTFLLLIADGKPVFQEDDSRTNEHLLKFGAGTHELAVFLLGAESHHVFNAGTVVPAPIEQNDLAGGREVLDVALEIPLCPFGIGWLAKRDDPTSAADSTARRRI